MRWRHVSVTLNQFFRRMKLKGSWSWKDLSWKILSKIFFIHRMSLSWKVFSNSKLAKFTSSAQLQVTVCNGYSVTSSVIFRSSKKCLQVNKGVTNLVVVFPSLYVFFNFMMMFLNYFFKITLPSYSLSFIRIWVRR